MASDPDALRAQIQRFLDACKLPSLLEEGDSVLPVTQATVNLEVRAGRLWLEAWNAERIINRRILSVASVKPGALVCTIQRLGGRTATLTLLDADRPASAAIASTGARRSFAERLRLMLARQFPGWEIEQLTAAKDLRRSFSSVYPRAHLRRGHYHIAALACATPEEESGLTTFALLWFDYLRTRLSADDALTLSLFLPERTGALTAQRFRWLTGNNLQVRLFLFNEHGSAGEVDQNDFGNLETRVRQPGEVGIRSPLAEGPEYLLEAAVRRQPEQIYPTLVPESVHSQVLTFLSGDRTILDLLAVSHQGRLAILELKAAEDLHLPVQALDYWVRIRWHASRGELDSLFPGIALSPMAPLLFLVAPATSFHAANATVLRYFHSQVEVQRIGVNSGAAQRLTVVMRLERAEAPISHR